MLARARRGGVWVPVGEKFLVLLQVDTIELSQRLASDAEQNYFIFVVLALDDIDVEAVEFSFSTPHDWKWYDDLSGADPRLFRFVDWARKFLSDWTLKYKEPSKWISRGYDPETLAATLRVPHASLEAEIRTVLEKVPIAARACSVEPAEIDGEFRAAIEERSSHPFHRAHAPGPVRRGDLFVFGVLAHEGSVPSGETRDKRSSGAAPLSYWHLEEGELLYGRPHPWGKGTTLAPLAVRSAFLHLSMFARHRFTHVYPPRIPHIMRATAHPSHPLGWPFADAVWLAMCGPDHDLEAVLDLTQYNWALDVPLERTERSMVEISNAAGPEKPEAPFEGLRSESSAPRSDAAGPEKPEAPIERAQIVAFVKPLLHLLIERPQGIALREVRRLYGLSSDHAYFLYKTAERRLQKFARSREAMIASEEMDFGKERRILLTSIGRELAHVYLGQGP